MEMIVREFGWAWVSEHYTSVGSFFIPFFLRAIVWIHIFTIVELSLSFLDADSISSTRTGIFSYFSWYCSEMHCVGMFACIHLCAYKLLVQYRCKPHLLTWFEWQVPHIMCVNASSVVPFRITEMPKLSVILPFVSAAIAHKRGRQCST
mgnify:CR=1 FL=1